MGTFDSKWDLRQSWQEEDLKKEIKKLLTKTGKATREIAKDAKCNHEQARRILNKLWDEGLAVPSGDKRQRLWHKA